MTQCFMLSDTSTVWVLVNVYQKDLPYVRVGDPVTIQTDAYPDVFHGRISYVAASLDPNTRTLQARIETSNPGLKLKKDMYVVASVDAGTIQNAIAVPDSAVLRDSENQPFVYVEQSGNQFGRRTVTIGDSVKGQTQITSGLNPVIASSEMAACSCSLRTRCSVRTKRSNSTKTIVMTTMAVHT